MRRYKVAGSEHQQNKSSTLLKNKIKIKNSRRSSVPFHLQQTLVTASAGGMAVQPPVLPDGWETWGNIQDHVLLLLCSKTGTQSVLIKVSDQKQGDHYMDPLAVNVMGGVGGDLIMVFVVIISFIGKLAGFVLSA